MAEIAAQATFFPTETDLRRWLAANQREKTVKRWHRKWKIELIESENPTWRDLSEDFGFESLIKKRWTQDQIRGDAPARGGNGSPL